MPSLVGRTPDDGTGVRWVKKAIVMVFAPPVLWLAPGPGELDELDDPDEPHAARAVQAATTRTAHAESRRRIGEPPPLSVSCSGTPLPPPGVRRNVTETRTVSSMRWTFLLPKLCSSNPDLARYWPASRLPEPAMVPLA